MPYDHETILDFSIPPWFIDTAIKITAVKNVPLHYVVLMPREKICEERAANRTKGKIKDYRLYHEFYSSFDEAGRFCIRDEESDPIMIAAGIRDDLTAGVFLVPADASGETLFKNE